MVSSGAGLGCPRVAGQRFLVQLNSNALGGTPSLILMSGDSAQTVSDAPFLVYGTTASYYTGKLEAYLRAKGIPYLLEPFSDRKSVV